MNILKIDGYLDGGTIEIFTDLIDNNDKLSFCIDRRIGTKTKRKIYLKYPKKDNSNIIPDQNKIREEILIAISKYNGSDVFKFKEQIIELLTL